MYFYDPNISKELLGNLKSQQLELQKKVRLQNLDSEIKTIAGCDSSIKDEQIFSIFVLFSFPDLSILEVKYAFSKLELPYIPGFLAFREIPNLLKVYDMLKQKPDLIMVDGHGVAHPRRLGIATHLGVLLNKPTIGVAKKLLVGTYVMPESLNGSYEEIIYKSELIGFALRSKQKVKPIFISPGNLISFQETLKITISCLRGYKLPEPTRIADAYSKKFKNI